MAWDVEYTDEFGQWWAELGEEEQESLATPVGTRRICRLRINCMTNTLCNFGRKG
jgi:hypothetical protein